VGVVVEAEVLQEGDHGEIAEEAEVDLGVDLGVDLAADVGVGAGVEAEVDFEGHNHQLQLTILLSLWLHHQVISNLLRPRSKKRYTYNINYTTNGLCSGL
jgi:hypothetical protein